MNPKHKKFVACCFALASGLAAFALATPGDLPLFQVAAPESGVPAKRSRPGSSENIILDVPEPSARTPHRELELPRANTNHIEPES